MSTALLTGCAKNSAETRLRIWNLTKNSEEDTQDDTVQMIKVVEIAKGGVALQNLRTNHENMTLFQTFVNLCLIHFTTLMSWRYKACDSVISEIPSLSESPP